MAQRTIGRKDASLSTDGTEQGPILVMVNSPQEWWSLPVREQRQIIGRSAQSDIKIPPRFQNVSRRHAEIWTDDEGTWIRDLSSRAGTQVNGIWLCRLNAVQLKPGDRIWLGGAELDVRSTAPRVEERGGVCRSEADTQDWDAEFISRKILDDLSPAELAVVYCMVRGKIEDEDIGEELQRSPHTVRTQLASIFQKIGVHSRGELLGWIKRTSMTN